MEQQADQSAQADSQSQVTEAPMDKQADTPKVPNIDKVISPVPCAHERLIDDVLTRGGKRTGNVRCRECGAVFADPYWPEA